LANLHCDPRRLRFYLRRFCINFTVWIFAISYRVSLLPYVFDERAGYVIAALCLSLFDDAARQIRLSSQIPFPPLHQIYSHYRTDKLICADLSS